MDTTKKMMDRVRERIAEDSELEKELHEKASDLDLHPQPWWDREFYQHAIRMREIELETGGGEEDD